MLNGRQGFGRDVVVRAVLEREEGGRWSVGCVQGPSRLLEGVLL